MYLFKLTGFWYYAFVPLKNSGWFVPEEYFLRDCYFLLCRLLDHTCHYFQSRRVCHDFDNWKRLRSQRLLRLFCHFSFCMYGKSKTTPPPPFPSFFLFSWDSSLFASAFLFFSLLTQKRKTTSGLVHIHNPYCHCHAPLANSFFLRLLYPWSCTPIAQARILAPGCQR